MLHRVSTFFQRTWGAILSNGRCVCVTWKLCVCACLLTYRGERVVDGLREPPRDGVGRQHAQEHGELMVVHAWGGGGWCMFVVVVEDVGGDTHGGAGTHGSGATDGGGPDISMEITADEIVCVDAPASAAAPQRAKEATWQSKPGLDWKGEWP